MFFGSSRITPEGPLGRYYDEARALARGLTEWSNSLPGDRRFVVCSGGGGGIMEAANRGARDAGGRTIGLNIGLPAEQRPNPYISPELGFEFHYFFMRKLWFSHLARALVVFPGGVGTLDELFEMLTLTQTRKLVRDVPIVLYGSSYWNEVLNFEAMVRHGTIAREDLALFSYRGRSASRPRPPASEAAHPPGGNHPRIREVAHTTQTGGLAPVITLEFIGAAQTVTGSKHLLRTSRAAVLLDCGLFQGRRRESFEKNRNIPVDGAGARRGGAVPRAHRPLGRAAAAVQARLRRARLRDARDARSRGADAARRGGHPGGRRASHRPPDRTRRAPDSNPSSRSTARRTSQRRWGRSSACPIAADKPSRRASCSRSSTRGTCSGSAIVVLDVEDEGQTRRLVFTGDLGRHDLPILRDPEVAERRRVLVTESTYGDRLHDADRADRTTSWPRSIAAPTSAAARCSSPRSPSSGRRRSSSRSSGSGKQSRIPPHPGLRRLAADGEDHRRLQAPPRVLRRAETRALLRGQRLAVRVRRV